MRTFPDFLYKGVGAHFYKIKKLLFKEVVYLLLRVGLIIFNALDSAYKAKGISSKQGKYQTSYKLLFQKLFVY